MKIKNIKKNKEKVHFNLEDANYEMANTVRRTLLNEVPTMAIEDVEIVGNSSALYDEVLAHRLGLIPLKTDLKSYNLPNKCKCKGEGCAQCQLQLVLKVKGPKTVLASDIKSKDPKVVPVFPKTIIAELAKGQSIELVATAVLGLGKEHAKWSPGLTFYKNEPVVEIKKKVNDPEKIASKCPLKLFEVKGGKLKLVKNYQEKCHLCEACQAESEGAIAVSHKEDVFMFTVEPWGQLDGKVMIKKAAEVIAEKCDEFTELVKAIK